jgi:hypothetical protein
MDAERWKQTDDLLQEALQVPRDQHDQLLNQACQGDTALLQEVRSLLQSHAALDGFLETPAINVAARTIALNVSPLLIAMEAWKPAWLTAMAPQSNIM